MSIYEKIDIVVFQNETAEISTQRLVNVVDIDPTLPWHMISSGMQGAEAITLYHTFDNGLTWEACKSEDANLVIDKRNNFIICNFNLNAAYFDIYIY